MAVKALYGDIAAPESNPVTISVLRPVVTEFTIDEHVLSIVQNAPQGVHEVIVKKYLGTDPLYKAPQLITYDDITYEVTGIAEGAYRDNVSLASVNLSETIREVGNEAFAGCANLIWQSLSEVVSRRLDRVRLPDARLFATVTFVSEVVPEVAEDAFEGH